MSWIEKLYKTYDSCELWIGREGEASARPLAPICHITKKAHIEITIDQDGNLLDASLVVRNKNITIVPCTEDSASKSSGLTSHPLGEELQYVAGDFTQYSNNASSGECFLLYETQLAKWCASEFAHLKAQAVFKYVQKKAVVKDLIEHKLLFVGSDGKLLAKGDVKREKGKEDIFSFVSSQDKAFIRWIVRSDDVGIEETWKDETLWKKWAQYYLNIGAKREKRLCMVTGEMAISSNKHPKYIRTSSDSAKLISANDTSGFTFRGRFEDDQQASTVSLEVSQKAHNALAWLIDRQGKVFFEVDPKTKRKSPGLTILAWTVRDIKIPQPASSSSEIINEPELPDTRQEFAIKFKNKMLGYKAELELGKTKGIQVLAMDSATKGRLAITYYREMNEVDYFERLEKWHKGCEWLQYSYDEETHKYFRFVGCPSLLSIAESIYGKRVDNKLKIDDKLRNVTIARLLPCILDNYAIPYDLVDSAMRRASNRLGFEKSKGRKDKFENEWNKTLSVACSLFKKFTNGKEKYDMLDKDNTSRDYLYGRLLAIAERLEEVALYKSEKERPTNAARYMQQFSQRPFSTWMQIHDLLTPYILRLGGAANFKDQIGVVKELFKLSEFNSDIPLTGEYLLGYYCQRQQLRPPKKSSASSQALSSDKAQSDNTND